MNTEKSLSRTARLDRIFGTPVLAVLLAILCNALWGSAFPFIKLGYRLFEIQSGDTPTILCFAGVRFMLGSVLVFFSSLILQGRVPALPKSKKLTLECCALGLWQTTTQYTFYYIAVAMLTGAFGRHPEQHPELSGCDPGAFCLWQGRPHDPCQSAGLYSRLCRRLGRHHRQPWRRQRLGRVLHAGRYGHLYLGRAVEQVGHQKGGQLYGMLPESGRGRLCPALIGLALGGRLSPTGPAAVGVLLILAFISGAGYVLWALLMKNNPVSRIAVFGLVNPVVNVLLSALLNGEPLFEWKYIAALVLVCVGIWLVNKAPARKDAA